MRLRLSAVFLGFALLACAKHPFGIGASGLGENEHTVVAPDAGNASDASFDNGLVAIVHAHRDAGDGSDDGGVVDGSTGEGACGLPEVCGDGLDNNCDGSADEGCTCGRNSEQRCYDGPVEFAGVGACVKGMQACGAETEFSTWHKCMDAQLPVTEICTNAIDDDCDGDTDEGCECTPDETRDCYSGPAGTAGVGLCQKGSQICGSPEDGQGAVWGPCVGEVLPEENACDGIDRACTGHPDRGCDCVLRDTRACYTGATDTRGVAPCHDGVRTCELNDGVVAWAGACVGEAKPHTEVCGNDVDEDCSGVLDNGCGDIACPGDLTTPAGELLQLDVSGDNLSNYVFEITDAPEGGSATAVWGGVAGAPSAQLTPFIVGVYTVRATGTDPEGNPHTCTFGVSALPHGLRVQLYWDGAGDVDLHLHNDSLTSWFSTSGTADDCYYSNRAPTWGAALDIDNTMMDGPENITVDNPVIGMPYTIAVHHYARAADRIATVNLFCGDTATTTPLQTWTSHPLVGTESGQCTGNDFWRVARVTFTSPSACTVQVIDDYVTSTAACAGP